MRKIAFLLILLLAVGTQAHALLGWDGIELFELRNFWPEQETISYVNFYGTVAPVTEPVILLLLGTGLIGLAGVSRKKFKK